MTFILKYAQSKYDINWQNNLWSFWPLLTHPAAILLTDSEVGPAFRGVCGLIYLRSWSTVRISPIYLWAESYRYLIVFMSYLRIQTSHDLTDLTDRCESNTPKESDKANSQMLFRRITSSHSSLVDLADPTISKAVWHFNHANGLLQVYRIFQNLKN